MKKFILFFLILLPATLAWGETPENNIYLRIVDDADDAVASGDYKKAERLLIEAMNMNPSHPSNLLLLSNLGMIRFYMGEDSMSLVTLDHAHSIAPRSVTVLLNRARVRSANGMIEDAYKDYDRACQLDSTGSTQRFYRGMLRLSKGDMTGALEDFTILDKVAKESDRNYLAWATYYVESGQSSKAIPFFTRLLEKEKAPEYYSARAMCYLMTDHLGEAADDIASRLEIAPDDGELYLCRSILNKRRYLTKESAEDARKAIELGVDPRRADSFLK